MTKKVKYFDNEFRPQVGDIIQWHECDPGEHHYLVIGEAVLKREEKSTLTGKGDIAYIADWFWEFDVVHLDTNTRGVQWYEEMSDKPSGYILISRVDSLEKSAKVK
jgi:hypothetical protein